jgi:pimeloyl-ACP methyl ester carboxylesterase
MHAIALPDKSEMTPPRPAAAGFRLVQCSGRAPWSLPHWVAIPDQPQPDAVPLIAVHGVLRDARGQALGFAEAAAALGRPVIAPLFDEELYPRYQRVVLGRRADTALLALLDELEGSGQINTRRVDLFGYSGGAQFAHRFALLYPHRIRRLTLAAAGWYTFPDQAPYPYGLAPPARPTTAWGPHIEANLERFLRLPIRVCVGELDNQRDELTRSEAELDCQQGPDRLSRAGNWINAVRRAGWARGVVTDIRLHELPDCGHDFRTCIRQGGLAGITLSD